MLLLQFCNKLQPSARKYAFVLLFLICTNIQFCKAHWSFWYSDETSSTSSTGSTSSSSESSLSTSSLACSTPTECARQCQNGEPPKRCCYRFVIEYYTTNTLACDFCDRPLDDPRLNSTCQCIISDGFEKTVFSINRMIPGPSIQVCENDTIAVDVVNEAEGLEVAVHWHGIFQNGYQYYDGVPHVTQCPILSTETFRYVFGANNSGTHFYHSHVAEQIIDGQYGSLIVRASPANNPHLSLYDQDRPEHVIVVSDLFHEVTLERFPGRERSNRGQVAQNFLVNGRGDWTNPANGVTNNISLSTFNVESGKRYRFRMIDACGTVCPIMVSIQDHPMQIIALDGENVQPISANAINMASGERADFVLNANQTPGQYWIYVRGLGECEADSRIYQLAILNYQGSSPDSLSPRPRYSDLPQNIYRTFNPLNSTDCNDNLCVYQTCKIPPEDKELLNGQANITLQLSFVFFNYSSSRATLYNLFNTNSPDYKKFFAAIDGSYLTSMFGNISYVDPPSPLISQNEGYEAICGNRDTAATCTEPCTCTNVYNIPLGAMVDVMIYDEKPLPELNHPFHLHGYSFCVLYSGQFNNAANQSFITQQDVTNEMNAHKTRLQNGNYTCCAPKDTVTVPIAGYVIIRFRANNPGWWFFHCHFSWHTASGMNLIFHVGTRDDLPDVPEDFPECYNWAPVE